MNYALNKPYQRLCMSRDLNGQRTKCAVYISVRLSSKRWFVEASLGYGLNPVRPGIFGHA